MRHELLTKASQCDIHGLLKEFSNENTLTTGGKMTSAAHKGALLLDKERPGWEKRIDVGRFDMHSSVDCVLGQLWGSYQTGVDQLGMTSLYIERVGLGFSASIAGLSGFRCKTLSDPLTEDWKQQIADRQPQAA